MKDQFDKWNERTAMAESMIPMAGSLYRNHHVVTLLYGRTITNRSVTDILKSHRFVRQIIGREISVQDTLPILEIISSLALSPCRIDIGKLATGYHSSNKQESLRSYVTDQLESIILSHLHKSLQRPEGQDVVLYGFGRIGRLLARLLIEQTGGNGLNLKAVVVRKGAAENDLKKRASLLRRDSVHGSFQGTITMDEENQILHVNGTSIRFIYSDAPKAIDYKQYGIHDAIIVDNTGRWRTEETLGQHLACPGAARVLLTAPGKGNIQSIVYGVNHRLVGDDKLLSAASCTTNAITPVLKALNDQFGIRRGHLETIHSYTNDQNLIDNYHKGSRRGRSAVLNMVITETGAASAVSKALPELAGKLTGSAIRVPTPNVSLAILNLDLKQSASKEIINGYLRDMALHSDMQGQIDFVNSLEVVSSDFVGNRKAGIVDSQATIVTDNHCILYIWYDNEFGYSCQVNRLLRLMGGIELPALP
ncbi:Glyceraldehyde-3-phosphate dehydrogenase-like protein [invertebrate metagenome]|uniref:Glyceraldehyde-3-phosphate dehydrogenase-like protein n=1 Tax=invertebrate metagenome TaxID=1711999 RepID=A0A2H9T7X8_9ZZZZ